MFELTYFAGVFDITASCSSDNTFIVIGASETTVSCSSGNTFDVADVSIVSESTVSCSSGTTVNVAGVSGITVFIALLILSMLLVYLKSLLVVALMIP